MEQQKNQPIYDGPWYNVQVCFVAGTPILMADGTTKPIEKIAVGDEVFSRPHDNPEGNLVKCKVPRVFHNAPQPTWKLIFENRVTKEKLEVQTTAEHPFYVPDAGWTAAGALQEGSKCVSADGTAMTLVSKRHEATPQPVYNIEVERCHTYYVGDTIANSFFVHNACPICGNSEDPHVCMINIPKIITGNPNIAGGYKTKVFYNRNLDALTIGYLTPDGKSVDRKLDTSFYRIPLVTLTKDIEGWYTKPTTESLDTYFKKDGIVSSGPGPIKWNNTKVLPVQIYINTTNAPFGSSAGVADFDFDKVRANIQEIVKNTDLKVQVIKTTSTYKELEDQLGFQYAGKYTYDKILYRNHVHFSQDANIGFARGSTGGTVIFPHSLKNADVKNTTGEGKEIHWDILYANIIVHEVFWHGVLDNTLHEDDDGKDGTLGSTRAFRDKLMVISAVA